MPDDEAFDELLDDAIAAQLEADDYDARAFVARMDLLRSGAIDRKTYDRALKEARRAARERKMEDTDA